MATATDNKLDVYCNLTENRFKQEFEIQNFAAPSKFVDHVPKSETPSLCPGNVLLQLRIQIQQSNYCHNDICINDIINLNIQLYGSINKGEVCVVGAVISIKNPFNYVQPMGNNILKKLSCEKDVKFQLITECQTHSFCYRGGGSLTAKVTGTILLPRLNKDGIGTVEELRKTGLPQELSTLLQNSKYSDVDISVDGKNFSVHRNILWSRSEGFAQLLEEMESKNKNILTITEFSAETLQEALNYIYTGEVPNINTVASDLLVFSERYNIPGLKILCESEIESSIDVGNACDFADLADRVNAVQLRSYCVDFIKKNVKEIVGTEKWKKFRRTNPDLVADIFESLVIGSKVPKPTFTLG